MKTEKFNIKQATFLILIGIFIILFVGMVFAATETLDSNSNSLKGRIEPGGHLDYVGDNLVKADFTFINDDVINLNGYKYKLKKGTHVTFENEKVTLNLKGGSFSYYLINRPETEKTISSIKDGGEFTINNKGELIKAKFEVSEKTEFKLKGYTYKLSPGSKVDFKDNQISITVPDGTKLEAPDVASDADSTLITSFRSESGKALILPNGDLFESGSSNLYFDKEGFYLKDKNSAVKNTNGEDFKIYNPTEGNKVYLAFDKDKIPKDKDSILLSANKLVISSLNEKGPAIFLGENNRFGIPITSDNTAAMQASKGKIFIEKPSLAGEVSTIKLSGNSMVTLDKRTTYGQDGKLYFDAGKQIASDFKYGKYSSSARVSIVDDSEKRLSNFDLYSNDRDQYAAIPDGSFKQGFYKTGGGFYISSNVAFNQLTPQAQKFYDEELDAQTKTQIEAYARQNSGKPAVADIERTLNQLQVVKEEERRKNPILASVRIPSGGGSGTIIGVDAQGYPIILTAGHLGGATRPGYTEKIEMSDGRSFKATVIAGSDRYGGSGYDYSLLRGNQIIEKIPYVPVSQTDPKTGDLALRIGCPHCGQFKQDNIRIGTINGGILNIPRNYASSIPGQSGGGLFSNGRLVGVISTTRYFTNTERIRSFLQQQGYSYLIKFIIVFLER